MSSTSVGIAHVVACVQGQRYLVGPAQCLDVLVQRGDKSVLRERGRAQLGQHRTQLCTRLPGQALHPTQLRRCAHDVGGDQGRGGVGGQPEAEQLLRHGVVQVASQPGALLDQRELAAAFVQPRVSQRDRRMTRQQDQQRLVVVGETLLVGRVGR